MFNSGITYLAPSLNGWYGAPGVSLALSAAPGCTAGMDTNGVIMDATKGQCAGTCFGTTLFLVGNNFSVHETQVVAGGRCIPFVLMSRQIMRVTVPPNAEMLVDELDRPVVDVHVATPYGVSNHLLVPAVLPKAEPKPAEAGFYWGKSYPVSLCPILDSSGAYNGCEAVFHDMGNPATPNPIPILNKTGLELPLADEGNVKLLLQAEFVDGSVRDIGWIGPLSITRWGQRGQEHEFDYRLVSAEVMRLQQSIQAWAKGVPLGTAVASFRVQGHLLFGNNWPPEEMKNLLTFTVVPLPQPCATPCVSRLPYVRATPSQAETRESAPPTAGTPAPAPALPAPDPPEPPFSPSPPTPEPPLGPPGSGGGAFRWVPESRVVR